MFDVVKAIVIAAAIYVTICIPAIIVAHIVEWWL